MAGILVTVYLIIGALAFAVIWAILIVSKRRRNKTSDMKRERFKSEPYREPNTKGSRSQP